MEQNRFLMEFINMRKRLNEAPKPAQTTQQNTTASLVPSDAKKRVNTGANPVMEDDITYKKIIDEKPPKADVIEYFRQRIEALKCEYDL
jgi:hypothetical protein